MRHRQQAGPGQESVWDYPRPPELRVCTKRVRILFDGLTLADTTNALCLLETSHPPSYYLPPGDIDMSLLFASSASSFCEWKGVANYFDVVSGSQRRDRCAWFYKSPNNQYLQLKDHVAFYAHAMDACFVGDEKVIPQPGLFYGGWITSDVVGPFKGEPGSEGW
jgi:uncharacterized protein (DUF427 family)